MDTETLRDDLMALPGVAELLMVGAEVKRVLSAHGMNFRV